MLDEQELVICSDKLVYVSLAQGQALRSETDRTKQKDVISVYRNRKEEHYHLSLEQFFYQVFITCTFKNQCNNNPPNCDQHRILMPKGMNCKPRAFDAETNICVGARVAPSNVNILPEIGLYYGAMGTVIEIVYKNVGPNDKEHRQLPDYVVVNFPNLKLPPDIPP